jgi:uncharacterized protein (DUF433 family)
MNIDWSECPAVECHPERMSGVWTFTGTRVPVTVFFENLDSGGTITDFVEWFDGVTFEQVHQVLSYLAHASERDAPIRPEKRLSIEEILASTQMNGGSPFRPPA